jgi:Lon protease-like protein
MSSWDPDLLKFDRESFGGIARLFPVPNLVVFPHVMQPLHIFEERYREMLEDALHHDRLIAMALLAPGWEIEYASRPELVPWACLGKVVSHQRLDDGRYNLLLVGLHRVRILDELDPVRSFRQAHVQIADDLEPAASSMSQQLGEQLLARFQSHITSVQSSDSLQQLLAAGMPLAMLTDLISYALPLSGELKQALLMETCVATRARMLLAAIPEPGHSPANGDDPDGHGAIFPPPFSAN